jgi:hypothetical protein
MITPYLTPQRNPDVGADGIRPDDGIRPTEGEGANLAPLHRMPRSLSSFVAGFKSAVTSRAKRELNITGIWQRNYYDHIIRSEQELMKIWDYIDTNPQKWQDDQLNPSAPMNRFNREHKRENKKTTSLRDGWD